MPRKTKKEKIISQYRKQIKLLYKEPTTMPIVEKSAEAKVSTVAVSPFFYSDLKKSILLVAGIIILEIGFNYLKLIK